METFEDENVQKVVRIYVLMSATLGFARHARALHCKNAFAKRQAGQFCAGCKRNNIPAGPSVVEFWTAGNIHVKSCVTREIATDAKEERSHLAFAESLQKKYAARTLISRAETHVAISIAAAYTIAKRHAIKEIVGCAHLIPLC